MPGKLHQLTKKITAVCGLLVSHNINLTRTRILPSTLISSSLRAAGSPISPAKPARFAQFEYWWPQASLFLAFLVGPLGRISGKTGSSSTSSDQSIIWKFSLGSNLTVRTSNSRKIPECARRNKDSQQKQDTVSIKRRRRL